MKKECKSCGYVRDRRYLLEDNFKLRDHLATLTIPGAGHVSAGYEDLFTENIKLREEIARLKIERCNCDISGIGPVRITPAPIESLPNIIPGVKIGITDSGVLAQIDRLTDKVNEMVSAINSLPCRK